MTNDDLNNLNLMQTRGIYRTQFESVSVPSNTGRGVQIGEGKCVAVILHLNRFIYNWQDVINSSQETNAYIPVAGTGAVDSCGYNGVLYLYYGDRNKQQRELMAGQSSPILFCTDLSEIYVKAPAFADLANDPAALFEYEVQLEIYHGKDNDD